MELRKLLPQVLRSTVMKFSLETQQLAILSGEEAWEESASFM
ncbi:hypothetical protein DBT_1015 [Dissulfuribacter thermophilus]|uniref:Uncharacterized protein n=1 Tax=Dissulfuribacter thermophilus TaxID=1156395 RepID=A0A1B9F740_9BACT|nr:hypothetical protein DBT_1015 [Dissulfuribacter thermophilus]